MLAVLWWWGPRSDPAGTLAPTIGPGDGRAFPASVTDYQECFSFFEDFIIIWQKGACNNVGLIDEKLKENKLYKLADSKVDQFRNVDGY